VAQPPTNWVEILTSIEPSKITLLKKPHLPGKNRLEKEKMAPRLGRSEQFHAFFAEYSRHGKDQAFAVPWEGTVGTEGTRHLRKTPGSRAPKRKRMDRLPSFHFFRCEMLVSFWEGRNHRILLRN